jgi:uncharacterized membrane protein
MDIGKLHVVIVHFPIALALSAALADILYAITKKAALKNAGLYCLVLAAIAAIPTVMTGWERLESLQANLPADILSIADTHKDCALISLSLLIIAAAVRISQRNNLSRWWLAGYVILMLLIVGFISATGSYGGMLTHGKDFLSGLF